MENLQQTIDDVLGYIKGIWLKKRFIIISTWLICPLAWLFISAMPDTYQSSAKVYADTRSILQPLLRGLALQTDVNQEVQLMAKTLLTTPNVEKIALAADLDVQTQNDEEFRELIDELKGDISFKPVGRENIYTVNFSHADPTLAQKVVEETVNLFVESTLGSSRNDSDTATRFLDSQIAEYEKRLSDSEQRLSDFKRENGQFISSSGNNYYAQVNQLNSQIESVDLQIRETESKLEQSKTTLAQAKESLKNNTIEDTQLLQTQYDQRIESLRAKLDDLLIRFTEQHPDVKETNSILEQLEKLREKEIQNYKQSLADSAENDMTGTGQVGENLVITIQALNNELASLKVRKESHEEKLADLQDKIDLYPQIEARMTALNRDYGITKRKYEELLTRRESANLSQQADRQSDDVQFRIIEPPLKPLAPSGPKRILFYTAALIFAVGVGVGLAFLTSQLNPVILRPSQLFKGTDIPVFGIVSHVDRPALSKINSGKLKVFWVSNSIILLGYAGFMTIEIAGYRLNSEFINKLYDFVRTNVGALI